MAKAKRKIIKTKAKRRPAKKTKAAKPSVKKDIESLRTFTRALIERMGEESHVSANDPDALVVSLSGVESFMVSLRTGDFVAIPHAVPGHAPVAPIEPEARPFEKGVDP